MNALTIGASKIHQIDGLYSLNDLHRVSGSSPAHRPNQFLRNEQTQALIAELETAQIRAVKTSEGRTGGTYACRELVIAYAAWISPSFHLKVIRVFLETKPQSPAFGREERIKGGGSLSEDVEAAISERVWDLIRVHSETLRQDIRGRVLREPARAFDIINTANLTDSLIPAQTRELRYIARLLDALLEVQTMSPFPENLWRKNPCKN